jgi:hypothetical protein
MPSIERPSFLSNAGLPFSEAQIPSAASPEKANETADSLKLIDQAQVALNSANVSSLVPLTNLLRLRGKPYTLKDHFPFEPLFRQNLPKRTLYKCGRQVAKTTSIASSGVLRCASQPYMSLLYVTPLSTQIRRLSSLYVKPFINHAAIKPLLVDQHCVQTVYLREFLNSSLINFSFAFLDVERVRGIMSDCTLFDETQDLDYDYIPIILECMSASKLGISFYTGTPKSLDNTAEALWNDSSKAEWVTKCEACGYCNAAGINYDLLKMIGKDTVVCAKCAKPIQPRNGCWHHFQEPPRDEKGRAKGLMFGYHVPQIIMPMHYEDPEKWSELIAKSEGRLGYDKAKYFNEVLGESCDVGVTLVSETDIRKASALGGTKNEFMTACRELAKCKLKVMGVDWGGGGAEAVSFTVITLLGLNVAKQRVDCYYAERLPISLPRDQEIATILDYFRRSGCHYIAHDYGGSGDVREAILVQAGMPTERIINVGYVTAPKRNIFYWEAPVHGEIRGYFALDKTRSLVLQAYCLKGGSISLPEYESSKDVTRDLLNLIEERKEVPRASDLVLIRRRPKFADDFAHALNFGCAAIWHKEQKWPDLTILKDLQLTEEQLTFAKPPRTMTERDSYEDR